MSITDNDISQYYEGHREELHRLFNLISSIINGRICHPSIILIKIVISLLPITNYMEIGVHNGGSMSLLLSDQVSRVLYGIDLFEDMYDPSKHYNINKFNTYRYFQRDALAINKTVGNLDKVKKHFRNESELYLIKGNTYFDDTEQKFADNIASELDLLFIDGDHTADGIKNDFERYSKYVKEGGYIILDDYHHNDIKAYVESDISGNSNYEMIAIFKADGTDAEECLIKKLV